MALTTYTHERNIKLTEDGLLSAGVFSFHCDTTHIMLQIAFATTDQSPLIDATGY
jgi:hypothetical protein